MIGWEILQYAIYFSLGVSVGVLLGVCRNELGW